MGTCSDGRRGHAGGDQAAEGVAEKIMNVEDLPATLGKELERRKYFVRMDILDQTASLVKIRLYITPRPVRPNLSQ